MIQSTFTTLKITINEYSKQEYFMFNFKKIYYISSHKQLSDDFGGYFPKEITNDNSDFTFEVKIISKKLQKIINFPDFIKKTMLATINDKISWSEPYLIFKKMKSELFKAFRQKKYIPRYLRTYKKYSHTKIDSIKTKFIELSYITKIILGSTLLTITLILILVIITMLTPLFITFLLFKISIKLLFLPQPDETTLAYFHDTLTKDGMIIYAQKSYGFSLENYSDLISHEHIHIIQSRLFNMSGIVEERSVKFTRSNGDCLSIVSGEYVRYIPYLLNINELEVRLHELICSYYLFSYKIPLNLFDFISLFANHNLSLAIYPNYINDKIQQGVLPVDFIENHEKNSFKSKHELLDMDIFVIFTSIEQEFHRPFIEEVLFTVYCQLLKYYGDEKISNKIANEIQKPNMYDKLYN